MTTAIIGGGAAGVAAAITAAERGERVLVLERNRKPLKKLCVTGNGRGNLLNSGEPVYFGNETFARNVLDRVGYAELRAFFLALGVPLIQEEEGRVYPAALQASVAAEALLLRASQLGVTFVTNALVEAVTREKDGFRLRAAVKTGELQERSKSAGKTAGQGRYETREYRADRVIVTVGGAAAPAHGTDGSGYGLLTALSHRLTLVRPALCALLTDTRRIAGLAGQRVRGRISLVWPDGREARSARGEILFAEDALSGIAAMQLARFYEPGMEALLDVRPGLGLADAQGRALAAPSSGEVEAFLLSLAAMRRDRPTSELLTGVFSAPVSRLLLREAGFRDASEPLARFGTEAAKRLARTITGLRLPVTGTRGFEYAQVTAGGIAAEDFDPQTMESRLCPGLYAAGEVLDVDGDCGGFNLMFAFASGILAGRAV